jgi:hypothetical protein
MGDVLKVRFAVRLPSRANEQHGRRKKKGGKLGAKISLPAEQRAATAAALGWWCPRCGVPARSLGGPGGLRVTTCSCGKHRLADERPPVTAGPEHPVDVLLIRVGAPLDDDNLQGALKAVRDEVTAQLWRWNELPGKPDDSAPWLRWCYEQTTEGHTRGCSEQCEIAIASREDGGARLRERIIDASEMAGLSNLHKLQLVTLASREDCGCGRSTLPGRWLRGEL